MTVLLISDPGSYIGKSKEQFKISFGMSDKPISYIPATKISGILVDTNITISSGGFKLLRDYAIPVIWQEYKDDGMILTPFNSHGSVEVRKAQYKGIESMLGVVIGAKIVYQSSHNKINTLRRFARLNITENIDPSLLQEMEKILEDFSQNTDDHKRICLDLRQYFMNIEAQVTKLYYRAVDTILSEYSWSFGRRSRRPALNAFNALLNYGYAILKSRITHSLAISGLDVYGGFLHTDRSGRESLVLDIMEVFRQVAVDEVIFELIRSNQLQEDDFIVEDGGAITIPDKIKKIYVPAIFDRLHLRFGNYTLNQHFIKQGRHLVSFLRGIEPDYFPYNLRVGDRW